MKIFKTSREIPALPEVIFEAFSNREKLAKWWGPSGFTNTFNHFQFKQKGKWSFIMHGPDGKNYPNESEFIEIILNEKIVVRHISNPIFTLTVKITNAEKGSKVDWIQEFDDKQVAKNVAHIVVPANEQNLDRLTEVVCAK